MGENHLKSLHGQKGLYKLDAHNIANPILNCWLGTRTLRHEITVKVDTEMIPIPIRVVNPIAVKRIDNEIVFYVNVFNNIRIRNNETLHP